MKKTTLLSLICIISVLITESMHSQEKRPLSNKVFNQNYTPQNLKGLQDYGTIKCVTDEYELSLQEKFPNRSTEAEFENWLAPKLEARKNKVKTQRDVNTVMTIPVIFHIFTDGSGSENVSETLINAQIEQLNIDYANLAGSSFDVAADTEIQFCLAQVDEEGNQLDEIGINRITDFGQGPFSTGEVETNLKPATQWDPNQYFNIWVADISGGILGYAQFPSDSGLSGLNVNGGDANTDGVAVTYYAIGSMDTPNPNGGIYGFGRTLTHEAGHWLGLRHIWGDGGCSVDDYCADTPAAADSNFDCVTTDSCTSDSLNDMIENYMDYTNDECMDTFTADQSSRIATVMENSPRRLELLTSTACEPAMVYDLDGRVKIDALNIDNCEYSISPDITLINQGNNALTSVTIEFDIDGATSDSYSWTGNLVNFGDSETITLSAMSISEGEHTFNVSLVDANGATDMNVNNDNDSEDFVSATNLETGSEIVLNVQPDIYGSEITWELTDESGAVLYSGGPYEDGEFTQNPWTGEVTVTYMDELDTQAFTLGDGCYTFSIYDSFGDGICIGGDAVPDVNGYYALSSNGEEFANSCDYGNGESLTFTINALSTQEFQLNQTISIYPNPSKGILNIKTTSDLPDNYTIYNVLGQVVSSKSIRSNADLMINTSEFSNGMYFIKINKNDQAISIPFIKE